MQDKVNKPLYIVMPCYFDIQNYLEIRSVLCSTISERSLRFVLIDDSSGRDDEVKTIDFDDTIIFTPGFNLGHQRAIVYGLRRLLQVVKDDVDIVTMDSDGEDSPEDVIRLLEKNNENKVILAKRRKRSENFTFIAGYSLFKIIFKLATGITINSGNFAYYSSSFIKRIINYPYFDQCYSSTFLALNINREFVECDRGVRFSGRSKMNMSRLIHHGFSMLMPFSDRIATRSLVLFGASLLLSVLMAVVIIYIKYMTDLAIPGWASQMLMFSVVISFISISNTFVMFNLFSQFKANSLRFID